MQRNLLLIDDDQDLREMVSVILRRAGYFVKAVEDGFAGFDELHANKYDLVILDISMPHLNGFKVLQAIRGSRLFANIPVIMLTASAEKENLIKVQDAIDDYVIKPPNRADLLSRIERILGNRPQAEEVNFDLDNPMSAGSFEFPLILQSVTHTGLSFISPRPLDKGMRLRGLTFAAFAEAKFKLTELSVVECAPLASGGFQCFASFSRMSPSEQQRLRDWIVAKMYKTKSERPGG